ncbi:hypothetical protein PG102017_0788 [Bifidobacterium pseudolongum subsp. globosum]|nr:hypothetical protein PG102017_0788 [Bifidobacterium pseudolongum subsp. globosum]
MNIHGPRNCSKCGGPIPSKNKQDCCDACIAQEADDVGAGMKVGLSLIPAVVGIVGIILKTKKK